jgi:hypothetical protein
MIKSIEFFMQDNLWYADVPNRTLEENEMVEGADTLLEFLADGHDHVTLTISTMPDTSSQLHLEMIEHNSYGTTYILNSNPDDTVWLCNVTHDVFDDHPKNLYIMDIKAYDGTKKTTFFQKIFGNIKKR